MAAALALVSSLPTTSAPSRILVQTPNGARQVEFIETDTAVPLISMALRGTYRLKGIVDTRGPYGTQASAEIDVIWRGQRRTLTGAVVTLSEGPDLVLPLDALE
jgi:hypothetical protein